MRKVFLEDLPRRGKLIDWKNSVGHKVKFIYDDIKGEVEIINSYRKNKITYLGVKYNNRVVFINTTSFLNCRLSEILKKISRVHKYQIGQIVKTNTGEVKILEQIRINKGNKRGYTYLCLTDGNIDKIEEHHLQNGVGCNVCSPYRKKIMTGYNDLWSVRPDIAKLLKSENEGYKISSGCDKLHAFLCPYCAYEKQYRIYHIAKTGFSCPRCGDGISYPNKFGFNFLEQIGIEFINEYTFYNIRFDFYFEVNNKKYAIEMDGGLGHGNGNTLTGQSSEETKQLDEEKDALAEANNIEVIRIDCFQSDLDYIKKHILNSKLSVLFNLSNIDWIKCHEHACSTLVKVACDYWEKGVENTKNIAKLMKINYRTVGRYLKQGKTLGWCDYDPREEMKKNGVMSGKKNRTKVVQLSLDGEFTRVWKSINEAERGVKIRHISLCCRENYRTAGGYKWMYYEDYKKIKNNNDLLQNKINQSLQKNIKRQIVICLNTLEIFKSMKEAEESCNVKYENISQCCRGKRKSAGKHPETGEPLKWMYYEDWLVQQENQNQQNNAS